MLLSRASLPCNPLQPSLCLTFPFPTGQQLRGVPVSCAHTPALALALRPTTQPPHPAPPGRPGCSTNLPDARLWTQGCRNTRSEVSWGSHIHPGAMPHTDARQAKVALLLVLPWHCLRRGRGSSQSEARTSRTIIQALQYTKDNNQDPPNPSTSS